MNRGRAMLAGLLVLFALPLMAAYGLYYGIGWRGNGAAAAGTLVRPIVALSTITAGDTAHPAMRADVFQGRWTLLQIAADGCQVACRQRLALGRAVRGLLHVDAARVRQALIVGDNTPGDAVSGLQPDVTVYRTKVEDWQRLFASRHADAPGTIYLIDPEARWMAFYPPSIGADALHRDLKRLLALSGQP